MSKAAAWYAPDLAADVFGARYHEHIFCQSPCLPLHFKIHTQLMVTITTKSGDVTDV